jgi:hypothetical protein
MRLSTIGAPELLALADEEVVPMAADLAYSFRSMREEDLAEQVRDLALGLRGASDAQGTFRVLAAAALTALAAVPGTTVLYQTPSSTRPVRLDSTDFEAFRYGRLRHAVLQEGTYGAPRDGDVVALLERRDGRLTGRDALAEVLHVTAVPAEKGAFYVVSLRPWRGAGTDSAAQVVLDERRRLIEEVIRGLQKLRPLMPSETPAGRMVDAMRVALELVLVLCAPRPRQAGQTSTRSSSSPSGQDGNVMGPPGKVSTTQTR